MIFGIENGKLKMANESSISNHFSSGSLIYFEEVVVMSKLLRIDLTTHITA